MAKPNNYSNWKKYTTALGKPPEHEGTKYKYGPFTVTGRTDIRSKDFVTGGGVTILGKGWDGWNDPANPQVAQAERITKPSGFVWGILIKIGTETAPEYVLKYYETTGNKVKTQKTAALSTTDNTIVGEIAFTDYNGIGTGDDRLYASNGKIVDKFVNKFDVLSCANDSDTPTGTAKLITTHRSSRADAYDIVQTTDDSVSIVRHYQQAGNNQFFRIRGFDDENRDGKKQSGEDYIVTEKNDAGGRIIAEDSFAANEADGLEGADFTKADSITYTDNDTGDGNDHTVYPNVSYIYLEDTSYDDDGSVYRSYSEPAPIGAVLGGGEVWLNLKYWPYSPAGRQPYIIKTVRIISSTKARDAFWVA